MLNQKDRDTIIGFPCVKDRISQIWWRRHIVPVRSLENVYARVEERVEYNAALDLLTIQLSYEVSLNNLRSRPAWRPVPHGPTG